MLLPEQGVALGGCFDEEDGEAARLSDEVVVEQGQGVGWIGDEFVEKAVGFAGGHAGGRQGIDEEAARFLDAGGLGVHGARLMKEGEGRFLRECRLPASNGACAVPLHSSKEMVSAPNGAGTWRCWVKSGRSPGC